MSKRHTPPRLNRRSVLLAAASVPLAGVALGPTRAQPYIEETTRPPSPIPALQSCLPAFIGYTQKADDLAPGDLYLKPKRISSMAAFERFFGKPQPETGVTVSVTSAQRGTGRPQSRKAVALLPDSARSRHILSYSLQMFFANGGGDCIIMSVGPYKPVPGDPLVADELRAGLDILRTTAGPTLIVMPEAQSLPIEGFRSLHDEALAQCAARQDRFVIMDLHGGNSPSSGQLTPSGLLSATQAFRSDGIGTINLAHGAAYAPQLRTTLALVVDEAATGITTVSSGRQDQPVTLADIRGKDPALHLLAKAAIARLTCILPPSGAIAGVYASVDRDHGVWKAPANVALNAVMAPIIEINNAAQEALNLDASGGKSVNVIRTFPGRGVRVWGARTLAGNDNEWRYIPTRRLFSFVEASLVKGLAQFVFEPNVPATWARAQSLVEDFLTGLWRQGALQGQRPEHAFLVSVGTGRTMTGQDVLEGRMILEIGLAVIRPAEFIIIRVAQQVATG